MAAAKSIEQIIEELATQNSRQEIVGSNALTKGLFEVLYNRAEIPCQLIFLCARNGLVLSLKGTEIEDDLVGYVIDVEALRSHHDSLLYFDELKDYVIMSLAEEKVWPQVRALQNDLQAALEVVEDQELHNEELLKFLDAAGNAISLYDKDANLLFANTNFYRDMAITDRDSVLGLNVNEILARTGVKVQSIDHNTGGLKMLDVLKKGEVALDWEVSLESKPGPGGTKIVSNDMYPVVGKDGTVAGMVEITRSRQQDLKRTRKLIGLAAEHTFTDIIGSSAVIRERVRMAKEFSNSPYNVLITGESGVGKELFAQSIHNHSTRKKGPFVALNCASIPENLIESELFGYVGGAFTGASKNGQIGKFELADGGTLFLDEVGELPYHFQSKLLRVLETWLVTRIGSTQQTPVNVRLVAATNRDLEKMVAEGLFREDLYYRLQVVNLEIPPLRERREDIILLADSFLRNAGEIDPSTPKSFDERAQSALFKYDWPGNVRELRNVIHRITVLSKTPVITKESLDLSIHSKGYMLKAKSNESPEERLAKLRKEVEEANDNLIREALAMAGGNKKKAAELLGVSRRTIYRLLDKQN